MNEQSTENLWSYDAAVNDPENLISAPFEVWRPTDFHVQLEYLPLDDEAAQQLEKDIRALVEAEMKRSLDPPNAGADSIQVSVAGMDLRPDRAVHLSQEIEAMIHNRLLNSPGPDPQHTHSNGD